MKRKLIASLLCLCMLVSLLPAAAFATDTDGDTPGTKGSTTTTPSETTGGDTGSGDTSGGTEGGTQTPPADAIIAAFGAGNVTKEGNTYKLTADVTLTDKLTLEADNAITINLNGHKITGADARALLKSKPVPLL